MSAPVLVTGAAGLLGRFVVDELLRSGARVRGLDRRAGTAPIEWHVGDVTDPAFVAKAVQGADSAVHIAAIPNIWSGDGQTIMRVNTLGTYTMLDAAEAAGVKRLLFCSSDSVAGYTVREGRMLPPLYAPLDLAHPLRATDPYAISKVLGEELCRAYAHRGMAIVALRTVFVAYPEMEGEIRARAAAPALYQGPAVGGPSAAGGGPLHHHIDPRDLARAFRLALALPMQPGGFEPFYLSAQVTLSPEPTLDRLRRLHGDAVQIRKPELYAQHPFAPLYDLSHAAERLGFVAEYDQRALITPTVA
jgi:nucleoside-diphosphate-sugar epimerase